MNIFRLLFELFLIYLAYKVIFGFIIPIYRTTRQMKKKMSEMQEKMESQSTRPTAQAREAVTPPNSRKFADDYIEYEEIK